MRSWPAAERLIDTVGLRSASMEPKLIGQVWPMSQWRNRSAIYLGLRKPTEPARRPNAIVFAAAGAMWGVVMFLVMPIVDDRDWSIGSFALWVVLGTVGFGGLSYLFALRASRSQDSTAD